MGEKNVALDGIHSHAALQAILGQEGQAFKSCSIRFSFQAQPPQQQGTISAERAADGYLTINCNFPSYIDANPDSQTAAAVGLSNAFWRFRRANILEALNPALADFYTRRESTLTRLEELNAQIIRENDDHRRALESTFEAKQARLEESIQQRIAALDAEYVGKDDALKARALALDERQKQLDDRDNTHARRQIQRDLKDALKDRNTKFSLTPETVQKRLPITIAFYILVAALGGAAVWSLWNTTQTIPAGQPSWFPLVRFALSLAGLASSIIFYIRWEDRWSDVHASEEFRLKRLDLDIDRASWLVEVMLEWRKEEGDIPKELIEHLANGLFEQSLSERTPVRHPAEDMIAALLSSSASLDLDFPRGKAKIDRKGIAQMGKKAGGE